MLIHLGYILVQVVGQVDRMLSLFWVWITGCCHLSSTPLENLDCLTMARLGATTTRLCRWWMSSIGVKLQVCGLKVIGWEIL